MECWISNLVPFFAIARMANKKYLQYFKLCKRTKKIKTNMHSKFFYATEVNYLWHTDIHYLKNKYPYENQTQYMIAFFDDCNRKILYYEIGDKKDQLFLSIH